MIRNDSSGDADGQSDDDFVLWSNNCDVAHSNNCDVAHRLVQSLILSIFATVQVLLVTCQVNVEVILWQSSDRLVDQLKRSQLINPSSRAKVLMALFSFLHPTANGNLAALTRTCQIRGGPELFARSLNFRPSVLRALRTSPPSGLLHIFWEAVKHEMVSIATPYHRTMGERSSRI